MISRRCATLAIVCLLLAVSCTTTRPPEEEPTATSTQEAVAQTPIPTDTPLPTETPLPATPTFTTAPTETATSIPASTATSTSVPSPTTPPPPPPTPTPALEPVTFRMRRLGIWQETVEAHRPVIVEWRWGVCKLELVTENLNAITFKVTIDGAVVATGDLAGQRSAVWEEDMEAGVHAWGTSWSYPVGAFGSGSFHWLEVEWSFSHQVTDGCDADGDGQVGVYGPGVHGVQRLEVTVL